MDSINIQIRIFCLICKNVQDICFRHSKLVTASKTQNNPLLLICFFRCFLFKLNMEYAFGRCNIDSVFNRFCDIFDFFIDTRINHSATLNSVSLTDFQFSGTAYLNMFKGLRKTAQKERICFNRKGQRNFRQFPVHKVNPLFKHIGIKIIGWCGYVSGVFQIFSKLHIMPPVSEALRPYHPQN